MAVANIGGAFQAGLGVGDARRANIELQEKLRIQKKSEILDAAKTTSETMSSFLKDIQQQREKIARSGGPEKLAKYDQEFVIPQTKNIAKSYLPVLQGGVQGGYISPQEAQVIMKQMETMGTLSDPLAEPENVAARTEAENQAAHKDALSLNSRQVKRFIKM